MKTLYVSAEVVTDEDGKQKVYSHDAKSFERRDEAVGDARKRATKYVGDTYGIFELTGTVIHPVPELDVTPVTTS